MFLKYTLGFLVTLSLSLASKHSRDPCDGFWLVDGECPQDEGKVYFDDFSESCNKNRAYMDFGRKIASCFREGHAFSSIEECKERCLGSTTTEMPTENLVIPTESPAITTENVVKNLEVTTKAPEASTENPKITAEKAEIIKQIKRTLQLKIYNIQQRIHSIQVRIQKIQLEIEKTQHKNQNLTAPIDYTSFSSL